MCHVGLFLLHAVMAKVWHSPTSSRMQQVLSLLDVLVHGHGLSGHVAYFTAPLGAKVNDNSVDMWISPRMRT